MKQVKILDAGFEILTPLSEANGADSGLEILRQIERAGRVCYKSEAKITDESCKTFVKNLIERGHEAMIEHVSLSVKFICDRGVSHEIVRHRIASYAQESTRYCNYSADKFGNEIAVIRPCFFTDDDSRYEIWREAMLAAEKSYFALLAAGATPQEARAVLPNSLKTELIVTMNLREWRHFFKLRTDAAAHPQMREIACALLDKLKSLIPVVFDDIR